MDAEVFLAGVSESLLAGVSESLRFASEPFEPESAFCFKRDERSFRNKAVATFCAGVGPFRFAAAAFS